MACGGVPQKFPLKQSRAAYLFTAKLSEHSPFEAKKKG
jgi:hypothetical protein